MKLGLGLTLNGHHLFVLKRGMEGLRPLLRRRHTSLELKRLWQRHHRLSSIYMYMLTTYSLQMFNSLSSVHDFLGQWIQLAFYETSLKGLPFPQQVPQCLHFGTFLVLVWQLTRVQFADLIQGWQLRQGNSTFLSLQICLLLCEKLIRRNPPPWTRAIFRGLRSSCIIPIVWRSCTSLYTWDLEEVVSPIWEQLLPRQDKPRRRLILFFVKLVLVPCVNSVSGTIFIPRSIASEQELKNDIIANFTPPVGPQEALDDVADKLLQLYPLNVPALGSPFNNGNETFGLSSVFKQAAAIGWVFRSPISLTLELTIHGYQLEIFFPVPTTILVPTSKQLWCQKLCLSLHTAPTC